HPARAHPDADTLGHHGAAHLLGTAARARRAASLVDGARPRRSRLHRAASGPAVSGFLRYLPEPRSAVSLCAALPRDVARGEIWSVDEPRIGITQERDGLLIRKTH